MSLSRRSERVLGSIVAALAILLCTLIGELVLRVIDGYDVTTIPLRRVDSRGTATSSAVAADTDLARKARTYAAQFKLADGVKIEWFDLEPPPLNRAKLRQDWQELMAKLPGGSASFDVFKLWNSRFFASEPCDSEIFRHFPGTVTVFDPPDGSPYPRYRFIPDSVTPLGLVTNRFGWRGAAVDFAKPRNVVRIAFVGASTTSNQHGDPYSYPELVGFWLNLWAKSKGLAVSFEALNMGREGILSPDIAAVVRHEARPMQPDYIVYYEGANQFNVGGSVRRTPRHRFVDAATYSALVRRLGNLLDELNSPQSASGGTDIEWPAGVDEFDPPLDSAALPVSLPVILKDLDAIRKDADSVGALLVLSSFNWNVHDGMTLDPLRHKTTIDYLMRNFGQYRYRDIERLKDFQNRVFRKFAATHSLDFLDVANAYPADPDLFFDPIHEYYPGVRLRAWLVLQLLIPPLSRDLSQSKLPRGWNRAIESRLPAPLPNAVRTLAVGC